MMRIKQRICSLAVMLMAAGGIMAQQEMTIGDDSWGTLPYQNRALTAEDRADDLIGRLTLEEKVKLMMDQSEAIPRLGIPTFHWWNETLHGVARNGFATVFPATIGMAASFNDALLQRVFDAASDEARVKNRQAKRAGTMIRYQGLSFWTPNINIFRDPRWGRGQETYGEDPYLTERMGLAVVRGLQGDMSRGQYKTLACAKHFAVHSGPEWNRHSFDVQQLPARDLWETYLPAFKSLVQKGNVAEVMCAYNAIDGQPCCGNKRYLQQILRDEWGFKGIVTSDCWALNDFHTAQNHGVTKTSRETSAVALRAGTDTECGGVYKNLPKAVKDGLVSETDINTSLKRLLVGRILLGDLDPENVSPWSRIPESVLNSQQHKQLAYEMARQSMVLLHNSTPEGDTEPMLPLNARKMKGHLAVIGPNANDSVMQWGNYSGYPTKTVTILEGIRKRVPDVLYVSGAGFVDNIKPVSHFAEIFSEDGEQGMTAYYWNNTDMQGEPVAEKRFKEAVYQNNGGATVFAPGVELENFSARYVGTLRPTTSGEVTLNVEADDGMRLIVNGDTLVNRYNPAHGVQKRKKVLEVEAGKEYNIQVDYQQVTGMAHIQFDVTTVSNVTEASLVSQLKDVEIVIFVGGISPRLEGEEMKVDAKGFKGGDRTDIQLPDAQRNLLKALHDAGKYIVFVNCSGSAMALGPETETCAAILQAWYPGERGGDAVADIIFGDYSPSGKLPVTFYKDVADLPDFEDYTMTGPSANGKSTGRTYRYFTGEPLWSFGHGLSYTTFEKTLKKAKMEKVDGESVLQVQVEVKNSGNRDADDVLMVYLSCPKDKKGPKKALRAFERYSLKAGETKVLDLQLKGDQLNWWDESSNTMRPLHKGYQVTVE